MTDARERPLCVRFVAADRFVTAKLLPGAAERSDHEVWDLSVTWPVLPSHWWTEQVWFPGEPHGRLVFGCRPEGRFDPLQAFRVRCQIHLDGPAWTQDLPVLLLEAEESVFRVGRADDEDAGVDLTMSMPWDMFVRWIADDGALFGDQVIEQLTLDGSIAVLSTIDGVRGLARVGSQPGHVESVLRWNRLWADPRVRDAVAALFAAETG